MELFMDMRKGNVSQLREYIDLYVLFWILGLCEFWNLKMELLMDMKG